MSDPIARKLTPALEAASEDAAARGVGLLTKLLGRDATTKEESALASALRSGAAPEEAAQSVASRARNTTTTPAREEQRFDSFESRGPDTQLVPRTMDAEYIPPTTRATPPTDAGEMAASAVESPLALPPAREMVPTSPGKTIVGGALGLAGGAGAMMAAGNSGDIPGAADASAPAPAPKPAVTPETTLAEIQAGEAGGAGGAMSTKSNQAEETGTKVQTIAAPEGFKPLQIPDGPAKLQLMLDSETGADGSKLSDPQYSQKLAIKDQSNIAEWDRRRQQVRDDYKQAVERIGWAEAGEIFGKALARIGAGLYGLKTGYDLSGADFSLKDWSKRYDIAHRDYQVELADAEKAAEVKQRWVENLRREHMDWKARRGDATKEAARTDLSVQEANRRNEITHAQMVQHADQFNASQMNAAAIRDADRAEKRELLELKSKNQLSPEEKARLDAAKQQFVGESRAWIKGRDQFNAALSELAGAERLDPKGKSTATQKALASMAAHLPPDEVKRIQDQALKGSGVSMASLQNMVESGNIPTTYTKALYEALKSAKSKPAPTIDQFFGARAAPAAARPTPAEPSPAEGETVERADASGRIIIYDAKTKKPLRYK